MFTSATVPTNIPGIYIFQTKSNKFFIANMTAGSTVAFDETGVFRILLVSNFIFRLI